MSSLPSLCFEQGALSLLLEHVVERCLEEIESGKFDAEMDELKGLNKDELTARYKARDNEK